MAWQDRIQEAAYTSPSGERFIFSYENVSKSVTKKTSAFNFPDAEGTFVQDLGHTGRRYPFRVIFHGGDYDQEAEAFEAGLLERGTGRLEHPIYGTKDVVPFGEIKRRDDLKSAANQAIIEVTFWETIGLLYPTGQTDPAEAVLAAVEEYNDAEAEQFEEILDTDTASELATFKSGYQQLLDTAKNGLQAVANVQATVAAEFNAIYDSISAGIDTLVSDPLTLAFQTTQLLQAPALALANIQARLDAYGNLVDQLTGTIREPGLNSENANSFQTDDLYASTSVTGIIVSIVNNQFETKSDALAAADALLAISDQLTTWRDANYDSLGQIDTGGAYQQYQEAVSLAAGFLVQISFSLKQERRIVLDRSTVLHELEARLYGTVDENMNFLIQSNDLTGDEIRELPAGKEIVYFI
jgi:prophage DNA circulation protein